MSEPAASERLRLPRTVWALGLVSLFMDLSSEIFHGLLPLFLTTTLGASVALVGVIDGISEATTAITKVFSGAISDRIGKRRPLILLGYGMAAATKPLFPLAGSAGMVLGARFIDRIGKGLRGAPRDALIADATAPEMRGRAYGLRQALDTVGAFLGPLAAVVLMAVFADDMRTVFWIATVPGWIAVLLVLFAVRDVEGRAAQAPARAAPRWSELGHLPPGFWRVTAIGVLFTLARFSESFLVLRAHDRGLPLAYAPLVLVAMNLVYSLGAYPAGAVADRAGPLRLLAMGLVALVAADAALGFGQGLGAIFAGIALWGAHMALTQGVLSQMVAAEAPPDRRASAFGMFNLVTGVAMLAASLVAGVLWDAIGPGATFLAGGGFAVLTLVVLGGVAALGRA
ncbi:MAG: MFS transporter [Sphingomonadales bacterium]|nr:MFS transporter [Sphingomonadales bacterium]MDE2569414.1 MFS transporter [Sphingomonadales bacterium]